MPVRHPATPPAVEVVLDPDARWEVYQSTSNVCLTMTSRWYQPCEIRHRFAHRVSPLAEWVAPRAGNDPYPPSQGSLESCPLMSRIPRHPAMDHGFGGHRSVRTMGTVAKWEKRVKETRKAVTPEEGSGSIICDSVSHCWPATSHPQRHELGGRCLPVSMQQRCQRCHGALSHNDADLLPRPALHRPINRHGVTDFVERARPVVVGSVLS